MIHGIQLTVEQEYIHTLYSGAYLLLMLFSIVAISVVVFGAIVLVQEEKALKSKGKYKNMCRGWVAFVVITVVSCSVWYVAPGWRMSAKMIEKYKIGVVE